LDDFKRYNDKYGHLAGDKRLKKFGSIITTQIREVVDSGYRYGGDEFAVILSDAGPDTCQTIAKRIASVFREECDGAGVSFGYANMSDNMTPESLVAEADRCLYEDKEKKKDISIPGRKYG
jgi:diguanylate cyclase (GGDEF)-like protein